MKPNWVTAGVLAGAVVFFWSFLSHMVLGLGDAGLTGLPSDSQVLAGLQQGLPQPGMYFFPHETDQAKMAEALVGKPRGLLLYTPAGKPFSFPANLGIQFLTSIVCGWIAAYLVWTAGAPSFLHRAVSVMLLGIFGVVAIHVPYWNWYGATPAYVAAQFLDQAVAWGLAGMAIAWLAGKNPAVRVMSASARA